MDKSELISKFSNIYIMLLYSIMSNDITRVKHFLSDDLYNKYEKIVKDNIENDEQQMYDELNVYEINILKIEEVDSKEIVTVKLVSRYMDYVIDKKTGKLKRGINTQRIEKTNILVFEKSIKLSESKIIYTCPNCSANIDVNFNGVCSYCGKSIEFKGSDYILTSLEIV